MLRSLSFQHWLHWLAVLAVFVGVFGSFATPARADEPAPDPVGAYQMTPTPLSVPNYTKLDPDKATPKDVAAAVDAVAQSASRSYFSINFVWVLVAGFPDSFMQAGFALVETGLIRAKNAAHTFSMNFCVYALGMFGFFVCGFAFMCGGLNGTGIGGPGPLCATPPLYTMLTARSSVNRSHAPGARCT